MANLRQAGSSQADSSQANSTQAGSIRADSILVHVGLDLVGDGLMKLPFVYGLRAAFPKARITWLAGRGKTVYAGVLKGAVTGLIDEVIERTDIGVSVAELLRNPLPGRAFDLIVDTQKGALATLALHRVRHGAMLAPFGDFLLSGVKPPKGYKSPRNLQRQLLDLVEIASGTPAPKPGAFAVSIAATLRDLAARLLPQGPVYVGLVPGAGGAQKCWPLERYIELAQRQAATGRVPVFILGPAEAGWDASIKQAVPSAQIPLQQDAIGLRHGFAPELTIALAQRMAAIVANDSGAGHMCALSGAPLISLFGPTPPEKFAPISERISIVRAQDFGGREMALIPVDAVAKALEASLV
jgi:ADP-heptose:LPS heptosyltransferase